MRPKPVDFPPPKAVRKPKRKMAWLSFTSYTFESFSYRSDWGRGGREGGAGKRGSLNKKLKGRGLAPPDTPTPGARGHRGRAMRPPSVAERAGPHLGDIGASRVQHVDDELPARQQRVPHEVAGTDGARHGGHTVWSPYRPTRDTQRPLVHRKRKDGAAIVTLQFHQ